MEGASAAVWDCCGCWWLARWHPPRRRGWRVCVGGRWAPAVARPSGTGSSGGTSAARFRRSGAGNVVDWVVVAAQRDEVRPCISAAVTAGGVGLLPRRGRAGRFLAGTVRPPAEQQCAWAGVARDDRGAVAHLAEGSGDEATVRGTCSVGLGVAVRASAGVFCGGGAVGVAGGVGVGCVGWCQGADVGGGVGVDVGCYGERGVSA